MRWPSLFVGLVGLLAALQGAAAADTRATDLRIQLNPALAALHATDPAKAQAVVDALARIIEQDKPASPPPTTRSLDSPQERALIDGNPLLQEAWRIDPKAALEQLREIVASGGGS